jgi:uncharacterized protein (DUF2384 family)
MSWAVPVLSIEPPKDAAALADVLPLLERLSAGFGVRPLAELLGVEGGTVANWLAERRGISTEYGNRIVELHDVMTRALRIFPPQVAMDWLVGHEPHLQGARPIDVLVRRGAAPLITALQGIDAGGYA